MTSGKEEANMCRGSADEQGLLRPGRLAPQTLAVTGTMVGIKMETNVYQNLLATKEIERHRNETMSALWAQHNL